MKASPYTITEILRLQYPEQYSSIIATLEDIPQFTNEDLARLWQKFQNEKGAKQLYIGACLYLYSPFTLSINARVSAGLVSGIAEVLDCGKANVSNQIGDIIFWYTNYQQFRETILEII